MNYLKPVKLLGLEFKNPLTNASGVISDSIASLDLWRRAGVGGLEAKTCTLYKRKPNYFNYLDNPPKLIMIRGPNYTINSMGLPQKGLAWFKEELKKRSYELPLFVSVATGTGELSEYSTITKELEPYADAFVINVSCPNTDREIICRSKDSMEEIFSTINTKKPLIAKLSCYSDPSSLKKVVLDYDEVGKYYLKERPVTYVPDKVDVDGLRWVLDLLDDCGVKCIGSINTIPTKYPLLGPPQGGLSGRPIHDIAIKQLKAIKEYSNFDVIYSGGVMEAQDVKQALDNGASLVQLGSGVFQYDSPGLFVKAIMEGM